MSAFLKKCAEKSKGYLINWSFRACRECSEVAAVEMTTIQIPQSMPAITAGRNKSIKGIAGPWQVPMPVLTMKNWHDNVELQEDSI
ncbi:MAG: hypothetical protein VW989_03955 [Rhodobiaceae bacterium]